MTPSEAIARLGAGELLMAPPTIEMLQRLEPHGDAEGMVQAVVARGLAGAGSVVSTRLSPLVHVVLAPNPGLLTGPGTNTYVVGTGPTLVIDPAVDDAGYLEAVLEAADDVDSILVTHRHPDHVGGAAALAARTGAKVRAFGSADAGEAPVLPLADGDVIQVPGVALACIYTPGHAQDHLCFHMTANANLFSGDNVLGEGTAVIAPPEGDMRAYLESLSALGRLNVQRIYPGHFRALDDGNEVIRRYLYHRREREQAILNVLQEGPATAEIITERVYTDTPAALLPIARYSVIAHLEMAEADGRVSRREAQWRLSAEG
jgi:glyoxylase-like metal-dependent hydrolase (beta-lactamase superfamily II)